MNDTELGLGSHGVGGMAISPTNLKKNKKLEALNRTAALKSPHCKTASCQQKNHRHGNGNNHTETLQWSVCICVFVSLCVYV